MASLPTPVDVPPLRGITWEHPRGRLSVEGAARVWASVFGRVPIVWEARSLQGFADQPLEQLVSDYDLLVIDHPHIPLAAEQDLLVALDEVITDADMATLESQSLGDCHLSYAYGGHQYALAIDAAAQVAAYRPDLLPVPPTSWDEVLRLARDGKVLWPAKPIDAVSSFMTIAANSGAPIGTPAGDFISPEAGSEVLTLLHRLTAEVPSACLQADPITVLEELSLRDDYCYVPLTYGYSNYSRPGVRPHRVAFAPIPTGPLGHQGSCLGGAGIAVSAHSSRATEAAAHACWLASAQVQRGVYFRHGGQPANRLAWEDPALNEETLDFFNATRSTLEGAWIRPRLRKWLSVQGAFGEVLNATLKGEMSDADCLARGATLYLAALDSGVAS